MTEATARIVNTSSNKSVTIVYYPDSTIESIIEILTEASVISRGCNYKFVLQPEGHLLNKADLLSALNLRSDSHIEVSPAKRASIISHDDESRSDGPDEHIRTFTLSDEEIKQVLEERIKKEEAKKSALTQKQTAQSSNNASDAFGQNAHGTRSTNSGANPSSASGGQSTSQQQGPGPMPSESSFPFIKVALVSLAVCVGFRGIEKAATFITSLTSDGTSAPQGGTLASDVCTGRLNAPPVAGPKRHPWPVERATLGR